MAKRTIATRALGICGLVALTGAAVAFSASPAGATTVSTEAELQSAFNLILETNIVLANDIDLTCVGGGDLDRGGAAAELTLYGAGFTITQTCAGERVIENGNNGLTLNNVTITGASGPSGAVDSSGEILTITNSTITGNTGGHAGGVDGSGAVTITNSTISANTGSHTGGVAASGPLTVTGSTITGNTGTGQAGGVSGSDTVTITGSTISGNTGDNGGGVDGSNTATITSSTISGNTGGHTGGVAVSSGPVTLTGSTISGNTGDNTGGISVSFDGMTVTNSTITGNSGGSTGGISVSFDLLTLIYSTVVQNTNDEFANLNIDDFESFGSVVAQPLGGGINCDVGGTATSNGYNLSDDASSAVSCLFANPTDLVGATNDPLLGALGNNGGPTQTKLPQTGSPLLDKIPALSPCAGVDITVDQRGLARPTTAGQFCDIGAVEVQAAAIAAEPTFTG